MTASIATLGLDGFGFDPAEGLPAGLFREAPARPDAAPTVPVSPPAPAPAPGAIPVRVEGLAKSFGPTPVLAGIDLAIPAGQFVAVVGRSGCGKSTLLRLLVGLEEPSAGRVRFGEGEAAPARGEAAPVRGEIRRIMFQEPRLLPWARVVDNVAVGLGGAGDRGARRARALEALARVGLADKAEVWPATLSGGQRQRVALARALVSGPRFLALDEPLGALDALTRIEMQALIESVWRAQGFTAVLVTHDVAEAVALADRILVVDAGRIALDLGVDAPRPRRRGDPALAALEGRILDHLFRDRTAGSSPAAEAA